MKLSKRLLRESSYNTNNVSRQQIDYGGFYNLHYTDTTSDKQSDEYFVFVVHPKLDDKTHCLDLSKIEENVFDDFFRDVRMEDEEMVAQMKLRYKGYVKSTIRIGQKFYQNFIKPNNRLMQNKPYKTLEFDRIQNVRYIAYDLEEKIEE